MKPLINMKDQSSHSNILKYNAKSFYFVSFNVRVDMGHFLSSLANVSNGDVLVNDVKGETISGHDCLTASLWITGINGNIIDRKCIFG